MEFDYCKLCNSNFENEDAFKKHLCKKHFAASLNHLIPQKAPFLCPFKECLKTFPFVLHLMIHYGCDHDIVLKLYKQKLKNKMFEKSRYSQENLTYSSNEISKDLMPFSRSKRKLVMDNKISSNQLSQSLAQNSFLGAREKARKMWEDTSIEYYRNTVEDMTKKHLNLIKQHGEEMTKETSKFQEALNQLKCANEEANTKILHLGNELQVAGNKINELENNLQNKTRSVDELEELITSKHLLNNDLLKEKNSLEVELCKTNKNLSIVEGQKEKLVLSNEDNKLSISSLKNEIKCMQEGLASKDEEIKEIVNSNNVVLMEKDKKQEILRKQCIKRKNEVRSLNIGKIDLMNKIKDLEKQNKSHKNEIKDLNFQIRKNSIKAEKNAQTEIKKYVSQQTKSEKRVEELEGEVIRYQTQLESVRDDHSVLSDLIIDQQFITKKYDEKLLSSNKKLSEMSAKLKVLETNLDESNKKNARFREVESEKRKLKQEMRSLKITASEFEKRVISSLAYTSALEEQKEEYLLKQKQKDEEAQATQSKYLELRSNFASLEKNYKKLSFQLKELDSKNTELRANLLLKTFESSEMTKKHMVFVETSNNLQAENRRLVCEVETQKKIISSRCDELKHLKIDLSNSKQKIYELNTINEIYKSNEKQLERYQESSEINMNIQSPIGQTAIKNEPLDIEENEDWIDVIGDEAEVARKMLIEEEEDLVLCSICYQIDPPLPRKTSNRAKTKWVGCNCGKWYHNLCTKLRNIPSDFSCHSLNIPCAA